MNGKERPSKHQDILDFPLRLVGNDAKENYITEVIIPAMDVRRRRLSSMSEEDVGRKLWSPPASDKPGEEHELTQAMRKSADTLVTVEEALEIADVVYYYLQPNAPEGANREKLETFMAIILGNMSLALDFTIVKYKTRLKCGDRGSYREIEEEIMQAFFIIKGIPKNF